MLKILKKNKLRKYNKIVKKINSLEKKLEKLSDQELKDKFDTISNNTNTKEELKNVLEEVFAIVKEASYRVLNMKHFDSQLITGIVLFEGKISEMKTGEGKTLSATLAAILNSIIGEHTHIITINDFLAERDYNDMKPLYDFFGISTGLLKSNDHNFNNKKTAFEAMITYGVHTEFIFNYLRDTLAPHVDYNLNLHMDNAIIDEVDYILIDESRTPISLSEDRPVDNPEIYQKTLDLVLSMKEDEDFTINRELNSIYLTEKGIEKTEKYFNIDNLYSMDNSYLITIINSTLYSYFLLQKNKDYVISNKEIVLIDPLSGRLVKGKKFADGIQQAVETKENVPLKPESKITSTITYKNFFSLYNKISGMTGTALTEEEEFYSIYKLEVVEIPTTLPSQRNDLSDIVFIDKKTKNKEIVNKVKELYRKKQPVLIGVPSVEDSEIFEKLLKEENIKHNVLNAKNHEREATILKNAGKNGQVTVVTNIAGRGVDIKLDEDSINNGGLYIIGSERNDNKRIDNQLIGRSGRQGNYGTSQFYVSLEDKIFQLNGVDKIQNLMSKLSHKKNDFLQFPMIDKLISNLQSKIEEQNFKMRQNLIEYDDVLDKQRKIIVNFRKKLLIGEEDIGIKKDEYIRKYIHNFILDNNIDLNTSNKNEKEKLLNLFKELTNLDLIIEDVEDEETLISRIIELYNKKISILNQKEFNNLINNVLIKIIDLEWSEHLTNLEHLKSGIHLLSYNNKNPLDEYKKKTYHLFEDFVKKYQSRFVRSLFSIEIENKNS